MPPIWRLGQGYVRATRRVQASERRGRTRPANAYVKTALVQAAHTTARTQTYLGEQYRRLRKRRGAKRAAVAVGHSNMAHLVSHDDHRRAVSRERSGVLSQPEPGPSGKTAGQAAEASGLPGDRSSCCLRWSHVTERLFFKPAQTGSRRAFRLSRRRFSDEIYNHED